MEQARTKIIAHRGGSGLWPENSMVAFAKAIELATDGFECDLRLTADEHIVVMHDATVDRTTNGSGCVGMMSLDQLRQYRLQDAGQSKVRQDLTIPTLDELLPLAAASPLELRLEIKHVGFEKRLVDKVKTFGLEDRTFIISFFPAAIIAAKSADANIRTSLITSDFEQTTYEQIRPHIDAVDLRLTAGLDEQIIRQIKSDGLALDFWTVNTAEQLAEATKFDPDYITSDFPYRIMKYLGRTIPDWPESG